MIGGGEGMWEFPCWAENACWIKGCTAGIGRDMRVRIDGLLGLGRDG